MSLIGPARNDGRFVELSSGALSALAFPEDITASLRHTYDEANGCLRAGFNLACIGLCGRILETLLHSAYRRHFTEDPSIGYHAIRRRLQDKGYMLDASVERQMDLIYAYRNRAVHGSVQVPSVDEATAMMLLVRSVVARLAATGG